MTQRVFKILKNWSKIAEASNPAIQEDEPEQKREKPARLTPSSAQSGANFQHKIRVSTAKSMRSFAV